MPKSLTKNITEPTSTDRADAIKKRGAFYFYIKTYGCQMNENDSKHLSLHMIKRGCSEAFETRQADVIVFNTCNIREKAVDKLYSDIGRVVADFCKIGLAPPIIVVAGCIGQAEGEEMFKRSKHISIVIGSQGFHSIYDLVLKHVNENRKLTKLDFDVVEKFKSFDGLLSKNREIVSLITIQEGCDKFCSFCCVPYTRGKQYYRPFNAIITEAKNLIDNGSKEIILLGQNVNAYSSIFNGKQMHFGDLLIELASLEKIERIRYTSPHPSDVEETLYFAHQNPKIMPFIHLPVQSGSDKILKLMNRKHTVDQYLKIIEKFNTLVPEAKFSSDFIVGHPGETEEDFQCTLDLVNKVGFIKSFCFKYSARYGTPSAFMENKLGVDEIIKHERLLRLQKLTNSIQEKFTENLKNTFVDVLFDSIKTSKNGLVQTVGRTQFMQIAHLNEKREDLLGQVVRVFVTQSLNNSLIVKL